MCVIKSYHRQNFISHFSLLLMTRFFDGENYILDHNFLSQSIIIIILIDQMETVHFKTDRISMGCLKAWQPCQWTEIENQILFSLLLWLWCISWNMKVTSFCKNCSVTIAVKRILNSSLFSKAKHSPLPYSLV